uniref:UV-stimulated scaffold protein A C-terminal domain-containing protein n=1 Tax=Meloidogyne enterolobii TaxID=390850 RepID=A0A6V7UWJ9_MELEN|nr:unnamed protein product [Meloidogyne enterolobii]
MDVEKGVVRRCVCSIVRQFDYKTKEINAKALKELVGTVRRMESIIPSFVDILFEQLRQTDCDVRLCVLHVSGYFFQRSHRFRIELINGIQDFLVYTLETDPLHYPLPGPPEAACLLKKETITMLRCWIDKFGLGYQKLRSLGNYLNKSKSLDWENSNTTSQIERERAANEAFKQEVNARKVVEKITKLFDESRADIERIQVEAFQLSELLLPNFCSLDNKKEIGGSSEGNEKFMTNSADSHEAFLPSTDVTIYLKPQVEVEKSADNVDLIHQLYETTKQLEKWTNNVNNWLKKLSQIGSNTQTSTTAITKRLIDTKRGLMEELEKCKEFKIKAKTNGDTDGSSSLDSENDEFLDVEEKEGYEAELIYPAENSNKSEDPFICSTIPGPSNQNAQLKSSQEFNQSSLIRKDQKNEKNNLNKPKRLAMGLDLCYWGEERINPETQRINNQVADDCWWRKHSEDDNCNNEARDNCDEKSYVPRQITFVGELPILQKMCRAPLPSGKLCPRMEYDRCALHGPIIDRDEQGFPMEEQIEAENADNKKADKKKAEDEEAYIRDIEDATGMKLAGTSSNSNNSKKCNKTARQRPKPEGLLGRERLKTKLFDKRALKRVSETLGQIQKAKAERNFLHQFNYAMTRR